MQSRAKSSSTKGVSTDKYKTVKVLKVFSGYYFFSLGSWHGKTFHQKSLQCSIDLDVAFSQSAVVVDWVKCKPCTAKMFEKNSQKKNTKGFLKIHVLSQEDNRPTPVQDDYGV